MKEYRQKKSEELKQYRQNNKEKFKKIKEKFIENNPDYHKEYSKKWRKSNPGYNKKRKQTNPLIKLHHSISDAYYRGIKSINGIKSNKTLDVLGLESWNLFKEHIEKQWEEGMSWENYGRNFKNNWSIDHIIPISSAKTEEEIKKLNHYTNLRPMWHIDNVKKGSKI